MIFFSTPKQARGQETRRTHLIRRIQEEFLRIGGRLLQIERVKDCEIWQVLVEIAVREKLGRWIEMPDREQERCFLYPGQETLFLFRALAARARSPGLRTRIRYCIVWFGYLYVYIV